VRDFALNWDLCADAFGFLDGFGACSLSLTECADLTSDAQLLPVAAECLDSCSEETGCPVPMLGRLLNASGACAQGVPPAILMTLVDLPWGPLLSFGLAIVNLKINGGFNYAKEATLADRYPLPEYLGAWLQCFILLQAIYFTLKHVDPAHQGSTCGFLVFNTMSLTGAVAATMAPIGATLAATARGLAEGNSKLAMLASVPPAIAGGASLLLMAAGALPLFVTALPCLIIQPHIVIVQLLLLGAMVFVGTNYYN